MVTTASGRTINVARYLYIDFLSCQCWCVLEVLSLPDGRTVVVATEVVDNASMSITNAFELLATDVCARCGIDPNQLVWIEHYGYPVPENPMEARGYDRVQFTVAPVPGGTCFSAAYWRPMCDADWRELGLMPQLAVRY